MDEKRETENEDEDDRWEPGSSSNPEPEPEMDASPPSTTLEDMADVHFFGRPGHLQPKRSSQYSWRTKKPHAFKDPCRVPWNIELGFYELARLIHGYTPKIMEDKWFIYTEGPDSSGAAKTYFLRSWTGAKEAELDVQVTLAASDDARAWSGHVVQLTMEKEVELDFQVKMATNAEKEVLSGLVVQLPPEEERYRSGYGDLPEEHVKFQVLMACERVLGIRLGEITKPKAWEKLSNIPAAPPYVARAGQPTYRGLVLSKHTEEDIEHLGGMQEMFKKTSIRFTNR